MYLGQTPRDSNEVSLRSNPEPIHLRTRDGAAYFLRLRQLLQFVNDDRFRGEVRLSTRAYIYSIYDSPGMMEVEPLVYWHWSPPTDGRDPHVHAPVGDPAGRGMRLHLPTGRRVSVEQIVEHLIEEWGVVPARADWRSVLQDNRTRFETYRRQD